MQYFYPRSPCGERLFYGGEFCVAGEFLSTLSLRRATASNYKEVQKTVFLSTLSLRRATKSALQLDRKQLNFYPRSPCGERQQKCTKQWCTFAHMKQILWGLHLHADRQGCILPFLPLFFPYFLVRRNRGFYDCLPLALSKQDSILIKIRVQTHMLDFAFVMVSQLIKAQAVRF